MHKIGLSSSERPARMTILSRHNRRLQLAAFYLLILLLLSFTASSQEKADFSRFLSPDGNLELLYPQDLKAQATTEQSVLLLLRREADAYPSFNIILQNGAFPVDSGSVQKQAGRILDQYHAVGLSDAKLLSARLIDLNGQPAFEAELEYSSKSSVFKAFVTILTGLDRHYILTFIDYNDRTQSLQRLRAQLLTSLHFQPLTEAGDPLRQPNSSAWYLTALICLLLLLITAIRKTVLRQKKNTNA